MSFSCVQIYLDIYKQFLRAIMCLSPVTLCMRAKEKKQRRQQRFDKEKNKFQRVLNARQLIVREQKKKTAENRNLNEGKQTETEHRRKKLRKKRKKEKEKVKLIFKMRKRNR